MGVIPMKEDDGVQEIYTRDHGVVKVQEKSWQDGGHHIVLCPNGTYQHMSGLPIKDEGEIEAAFGTNEAAKERCLNWFRNRHDQPGKAPRAIAMHPDGHPVFDDGTIPDFDDLYAYFRPGKGLTGMIVALQDYKDRTGATAPPKELRKAAPPSAETVTEPSERMDSQAAPAPVDASKAEYDKFEAVKAKARIDAQKARERARAAKNRAKKAKAAKTEPAQATV